MKVAAVRPGSAAALHGIRAGDRIVAVNGHPVADPIDFLFHSAEDRLRVRIARDDEILDLKLGRPEGQDLGIEPEPMETRLCGDDCIFCFVAQNPAGVRASLLVKDEDYRHSLIYGSYITLDNLNRADFARIEAMRLSPLHVSVHTLSPDLRRRMLRGRRSGEIGERLVRLLDAGIEIHAQIVLLPGYTDGEELERTVRGLAALGPGLKSVAVVPVGLTSHRTGLTPLRRPSPEEMRDTVKRCEVWRREFRAERGSGFVYPSDELFLTAGLPLPPVSWYDDFPQHENGVGMATAFVHRLSKRLPALRSAGAEGLARRWRPLRVLAVTAALGAELWRRRIRDELASVPGLEVQRLEIENSFFGPEVTVSGLLTAGCLTRALAGIDLTAVDTLLLPPNCLNGDGLFLDDTPLDKLRSAVPVPLTVGSYDLAGDLIELLRDTAESREAGRDRPERSDA